jgi:electron transport complex protein RnfD
MWGYYPEGVSFSILFMNILSPYIEKWCTPKPFGAIKAGGAKK